MESGQTYTASMGKRGIKCSIVFIARLLLVLLFLLLPRLLLLLLLSACCALS
jgi:hypothetical protein